MEATKKIGPFKITPGKAKMPQALNNPTRYSNNPNVFQLAFRALDTFDWIQSPAVFESSDRNSPDGLADPNLVGNDCTSGRCSTRLGDEARP